MHYDEKLAQKGVGVTICCSRRPPMCISFEAQDLYMQFHAVLCTITICWPRFSTNKMIILLYLPLLAPD